MIGSLMESVVIALVIGGSLGTVTALHVLGPKKIAARFGNEPRHQRRLYTFFT